MSSNRHTYPLVNGCLKAPFLRTFEVETVDFAPDRQQVDVATVDLRRRQRTSLPMTGDMIDLTGIESNAVLVFTCYPDRQHFRRVVEKTETAITLQAHTTEGTALGARKRRLAGPGRNCDYPMWSKREFENRPLWVELRGIVPGWHGASAQ